MKKSFFLFTMMIAIAFVAFTSCKSHEKCPAYSKANINVNAEIKSA
jgi:hypothetical protein